MSDDRTCTLPDGRALAYRDIGAPGAPAVVFQSGFMACRLTGRSTDEARIVTVDRPGIGLSTPKRDRGVADWADDIAALADHLGLDRFAVLGHSAGSPYALACAARLGERVTALGIACGFAPFERDDATAGMHQRMAKAVPGLRRAPWMAGLATRSLPRQYGKDPARAFEKQFGRDLPPCDRAALHEDDALQLLLDAAVESTRPGGKPLATEMRLVFARPWNVALGDIVSPTHLWYGADDTLTPPQMGRYLESAIRHASLTVFPGEGHMAAFTHWDDIVRTLIK